MDYNAQSYNIDKEIIIGTYDNIDAYAGTIYQNSGRYYKYGNINNFVEPIKATNIYPLFKEINPNRKYPIPNGNSYYYRFRVKNFEDNYFHFTIQTGTTSSGTSTFIMSPLGFINDTKKFEFANNMFVNVMYSLENLKIYLCADKNNNLFLLYWGYMFKYDESSGYSDWIVKNNIYCYGSFADVKSNLNLDTFTKNTVEDVTRYPTSGSNDGEGIVDNTSDTIEFPTIIDIPIDAFTNTYKMTLEDLQNFKKELFADDFVSIIKKWWDKVIDCIVSLSIVPTTLTEFSNKEYIKVGIHTMNTEAIRITNCMYEIDCGYVDINEYYGNFVDYEQTVIQCYIPFVGFIPLKTVDVMGSRLTLKYIVNLITGCFYACINVRRNRFDVDFNACIYETTGNMFTQIPVTSPDFSRIIQSTINTIVSSATTIATGGASYLIGSQLMQGTQNLLNSSPTIQRSGNFDKNASICTIKKPFVLIERPRIAIPKNFESKKGFLANFESKLTDLKGYTEVSYINIENVDIPKNCIDELKNILTSGVIL